ncbi:hypothetical protein ABFY09_11070 [Marinomonas sp. 5E14-1]|uniref:hypothetical protein n=1 Tax=Marinomonas sp. 5E14-1 TaxID=3153922 RepID=UPI003265F0B1
MKKHILNIVGLLLLISSQHSLACSLPEKGYITLADKDVSIAIQWSEDLTVGQPFELQILSCKGGQPFTGDISASAIMPTHNHGMNYRPSFVMEKPGQYKGAGFLFHMFGVWQLRLALVSDGQKYHFEHDVTL